MTTEPPVRTVYVYRNRGCGSGCGWGCLVLILLLAIPVGWGWWFWDQGYKRDPAFRLAAELIKHDGMVQQVLGPDPSIDTNDISWMTRGFTHQMDYHLILRGSKGQGFLDVGSHANSAGPHLDSAILTGPDGRRYDLLKHTILPGNDSGTDI
jgi:hypothetical protein